MTAVDAARAEMLIEANALAAGATLRVAPQWLAGHAEAIVDAKPDCPHMADAELTPPLLHYPFSGTVRCGMCPVDPEPFCLLCGTPAAHGFGALTGLQVLVFSLCPAHEPDLTASTLG